MTWNIELAPDWFHQDPDAKPSYDQAQADRAHALLYKEIKELDVTW